MVRQAVFDGEPFADAFVESPPRDHACYSAKGMCCDLARFFFARGATSKMEIYTPIDPDFRSELVILLESNANACVCSIMSNVVLKFWPRPSYLAVKITPPK